MLSIGYIEVGPTHKMVVCQYEKIKRTHIAKLYPILIQMWLNSAWCMEVCDFTFSSCFYANVSEKQTKTAECKNHSCD